MACTATEVEVTSNNMISYPFVSKTPHQLLPQNLTVKFPRIPALASSPTKIVNRLGTLGITTSGLLVYGATEGPVPTESAYGDPYYNKMLDNCGGHAGPQSEYHLHVLITIAICNLKKTGIIGYAIDGFPIYGPTGCHHRRLNQTLSVCNYRGMKIRFTAF
ncbi:MAG: YHYH protein [Actinobacteria bacterium]|nr:YHYH protein [Actinomycetota bacterium]